MRSEHQQVRRLQQPDLRGARLRMWPGLARLRQADVAGRLRRLSGGLHLQRGFQSLRTIAEGGGRHLRPRRGECGVRSAESGVRLRLRRLLLRDRLRRVPHRRVVRHRRNRQSMWPPGAGARVRRGRQGVRADQERLRHRFDRLRQMRAGRRMQRERQVWKALHSRSAEGGRRCRLRPVR